MAIIYSYPLDATPQTSDLLIGSSSLDGNPTKTFTIASIASLVNTQGGTGTVTNVATTSSTFINVQGGPISDAGTITASLSAGGTPSATTFLRGDNTWAPATSTGSPNISIFNQGAEVTAAVTSINFTGAGVTTTGNVNAVTVNIPGTTSAVTGIIGGNGISVDQATGNVTVTNTGVLSLVAGNNVTLSSATGNVTINATNNPGTVQSVLAGNGLQLDSAAGTETSIPTIGVEYSGSNNYILIESSAAVPTVNDTIAFNENSNSNIKTTTFGTIPIASLPLVQTYIDTGDANTVSNSSDNYTTTAKVSKIVTLTQAEYTAIGAGSYDVNTLYVVATASALKTVRLTTVTNSIISPDGTGTGTGYTLTGNTGLPQSLTGVEGEPYSFTVTAAPDATHYFSVPLSGNVVSGTFPAATTTDVTMTLAGTVLANPTPTVTATLLVVTNIQGGPADGSGFVLGGSLTGAIQVGTAPLTVNTFSTTCTPAAGYTFSAGPVITNASATINGSQTVVTTITGTLQLT